MTFGIIALIYFSIVLLLNLRKLKRGKGNKSTKKLTIINSLGFFASLLYIGFYE